MSSRAQAGSRISLRGRKPFITGLMSSTGVPSMASSPRTRRDSPSTDNILQTVTPMRLGRSLPRWAKMPTFGQAGMARAGVDLAGVGAVEMEDHLDMGEGVEARRGIGGEPGGVEDDLGIDLV